MCLLEKEGKEFKSDKLMAELKRERGRESSHEELQITEEDLANFDIPNLSYKSYIKADKDAYYKPSPGKNCFLKACIANANNKHGVKVKTIEVKNKLTEDSDDKAAGDIKKTIREQEKSATQVSEDDTQPVKSFKECAANFFDMKGGYKSLKDTLNPNSALGLRWEAVDENVIKTLKKKSKQIKNLALADALRQKDEALQNPDREKAPQQKDRSEGSLSFTKDEFKKFKVSKLSRTSYIMVGGKYFKPGEDHSETQHHRRTKIIKHINALEEQKIIKVDTVKWDKYASEAEKRAINRAGFLFVNYEVQYWWYEIYETIKKLYFTCMVTLLQDGTSFQQMAAFLVNFAALIIHLVCRPWVNGKLDTMQAYSILVQTITIFYSIMLFIMQKSDDASAGSSGGRFFVEILVIVVNCFVTVFPLLNTISSFMSTLVEDFGIGPGLRRIPIASSVLFIWDVCLFSLAIFASTGSLPAGSTTGAYFQLALQSFACFIGVLLILNVIRVVIRLFYQVDRMQPGRFLCFPLSPNGRQWLLIGELLVGILQIIPLFLLWNYLPEASKNGSKMTAAKYACVIPSGLAVFFMCVQIYIVDNMKEIGWKAIQTQQENEAFGFVFEDDEDEAEKKDETKNKEENPGQRRTGNPVSDEQFSELSIDSSDEEDEEEEDNEDDEDFHEQPYPIICPTCRVKPMQAAETGADVGAPSFIHASLVRALDCCRSDVPPLPRLLQASPGARTIIFPPPDMLKQDYSNLRPGK